MPWVAAGPGGGETCGGAEHRVHRLNKQHRRPRCRTEQCEKVTVAVSHRV